LRRRPRRPASHARGDDRRARGASTLDPSAEAALKLQFRCRPADAFGDLRVAPTMAARPDPMRFQNVAIPATATPSAPERTQHQEWDELADRVAAPPFLRPGWIDAWCPAFAKAASPVREVRSGCEQAG